MNKFELVKNTVSALSENLTEVKLVDIGCRNCQLKEYVQDFCQYTGVDLTQNEAMSVNYVLDVSKGLPFADNSFDFVVALDVLEHLDDFYSALEDLVRISKRHIIIMLPNLAHFLFRLNFLRFGRLSAKYDLIYGQAQDRHRWLTVLDQSDAYMKTFAQEHNLKLQIHWFNDSQKKQIFAKIAKITGFHPKLWVWSSYYIFSKSNTE